MKAIQELVVERQRYLLIPCKKGTVDPCPGCVGWAGSTSSGKNLCTEFGEACIDETKFPANWQLDAEYVAPPEPVTQEQVELLEW